MLEECTGGRGYDLTMYFSAANRLYVAIAVLDLFSKKNTTEFARKLNSDFSGIVSEPLNTRVSELLFKIPDSFNGILLFRIKIQRI